MSNETLFRRSANAGEANIRSSAYTPHFGVSPLSSELAAKYVVDSTDTYAFTPWRNLLTVKEDPNVLLGKAALHDAFLVSFILSVIIGLGQMVWRYFGIGYKSIDQIAEKKNRIALPIATEDGSSRTVQILGDAQLVNLASKKQETEVIYAVLVLDEKTHRYFVVEAELPTGLELGKNDELLKDILSAQFAKWDEIARNQKREAEKSWWQKIRALSFKELFEKTLIFFFNMALRYWVLWFITAGFIGFTTAFVIPFNLPAVAFAVPAAWIVAEYIVWAIFAYKNRHTVSDPRLNNIAENLLKIKLAQAAVSTQKTDSLKNLTDLKAWANTEGSPRLKSLVTSKSLWNDQLLHAKSNLRIALKTITGFATFFIIVSFVAWPLTDLLAVHGISITAFAGTAMASAISIAVVPMVAALIVGALFAVWTYKKARKEEQKLINAKNELDAKLADKEDKTVFSQTIQKLNELVLEVELRRAYLKSLGIRNLDCMISTNNPGFSERLSLDEKTTWLSRFGEKAKSADLLVKGLGGGALLVRLFLGFVASFVQIGLISGFSYVSLPVILPLVLVATIWGGVQVLQYYKERQFAKAQRSLDQISAELETYEAENRYLKSLEVAAGKTVQSAKAAKAAKGLVPTETGEEETDALLSSTSTDANAAGRDSASTLEGEARETFTPSRP